MLVVAVDDPHTEEAIDCTDSVDPEVTIEDAYYMPGHRQELLTLKEATKRCFIHQRVVVNIERMFL